MSVIDAVFFDKKFSASRHLLHLVAGGASDEQRAQQLERVRQLRRAADAQIDGVIDSSFANFNSSLASFAAISSQLQDTRDTIQQVSKRAADGKAILSAKTRSLREMLLQQQEAQQVVAIIRDIECIEAAPAQIDSLLGQRRFPEAVGAFANALDLVFSEQLVGFRAMTGLRDALMECKQTIEERLVQELTRVIYLQSAFANVATRINQYSMAAIEQEVSRSDVELDHEFQRLLQQATTVSSNAPPHTQPGLSSPTSSTLHTSTNVLQSAVTALKRLHREREAIGALKSSMEHELDAVVGQVTRICRAVFNAGSCTSLANGFLSESFGSHALSANFGAFLRLLFGMLRRIAQRHFLVAAYFDADGEHWNYGMQEVVTTISGVLERVVGEYLEDASSLKTIADAELDPAASSGSGELFKLSRNKPKNGKRLASLHDDTTSRANQDEDPQTAARYRRVCDPSVFHLPEVYEDLERMAHDLQYLFLASDAHGLPRASTSTAHSGFGAFLKAFITHKWVPKVRNKAQAYLALKTRSAAVTCRLPTPSDTSYQPPNVDNLLSVTDRLCELMAKMPAHAAELVAVLDTAVRSWLDECVAIVRDIREPTLNHQQQQSSSESYSDLLAAFHEYEGYCRAKQGSPVPFIDSMVQPSPSSSTAGQRRSPEEIILALERDLEHELYDPDAWTQGTQGLLMDNARIAMLGYVNAACDLVAEQLMSVAIGASVVSSTLVTALQVSSRKCSALADECLFFLRREIRLHCCFYLTQLVSQRFDMSEDAVAMAQDAVLGLNLNLSAMENALQPYLANDKMALTFDGVDALLARLLIDSLSQMHGCIFTRGGVQQMLLNISALRQGLTGTLYSYPRTGGAAGPSLSCSSSSRLEHAKRFYQLLNLSETQLEVFVLANRGAYSTAAFRALWHVNASHRPLSQDSINKLDSLLR